ncbi:MAG: hypothetical protein F9K34_11375 [Albidovulum sp.]|uniref:hypothetical protein n=1 Tax=Albidovulum sp. TaxID=1872424 RepID=UPI001324767B|nr:hypothetical protein [Defluviimonas sp.]KAB2883574.1 MAG: hypothetical protein F9K34_11375 [Defluviimonas sp.]
MNFGQMPPSALAKGSGQGSTVPAEGALAHHDKPSRPPAQFLKDELRKPLQTDGQPHGQYLSRLNASGIAACRRN